ncbi:MAG: DUF3467 domain-containing protein [Pyrinomonadaceae bacterium]|nr:DUF3467 domain-containing protein [Pyrinomonadaceae bacterium]
MPNKNKLPIASPQQQMKVIRSEDYRTVYTNAAKIGLTTWDVRLTFSTIVEAEVGKLATEEQVTVIMSPQHAKDLLRVFVINLANWEKQFGAIKIPSDFEIEPTLSEGADSGSIDKVSNKQS